MDTASFATKSAAPYGGTPLDSVVDQTNSSSENAGEMQKPTDGELERLRENGNTLAPIVGKSVKLPPPPNTCIRGESAAFMLGYTLCLRAVEKGLGMPRIYSDMLIQQAEALVRELYPPFDPSPEPQKRGEDGRRKDGIIMEK